MSGHRGFGVSYTSGQNQAFWASGCLAFAGMAWPNNSVKGTGRPLVVVRFVVHSSSGLRSSSQTGQPLTVTLGVLGESMSTIEENAEVIRQLIQHENELTNHRMGWLNTVQGLLFASLAFAWDSTSGTNLITILSVVGIGSAILAYVSLLMSSYAMNQLLGWWDQNSQGYTGPPVIGAKFVPHTSILAFFAPSNLLSLLFIFAWVGVLMSHCNS